MTLDGNRLALFDIQLCNAVNALERADRITDEDLDHQSVGNALAQIDACLRRHHLEPPDVPRHWPPAR